MPFFNGKIVKEAVYQFVEENCLLYERDSDFSED